MKIKEGEELPNSEFFYLDDKKWQLRKLIAKNYLKMERQFF